MNPGDVILLATRHLRRRGTRTILTGAGVALGNALLVALVAISATADSRVVGELSKGGPLAAIHVDDSHPSESALLSDTLSSAGHHDIDPAGLLSIRHARHVASAVGVLSLEAYAVPCPAAEGPPLTAHPPAACRAIPDPYQATLVGADLTQAAQLPVTVLSGRLPFPGSLNEVAVSRGYTDRIHRTDPGADVLGTMVELGTPRIVGGDAHIQVRWFQAQVVGVVAQSIETGDFLVPIQQTEAARAFALSGERDPHYLPGISSSYSAVVVVADSLDAVHTVRTELFDLGYANSAPEHLVASVLRYLHVVDIVLAGIGLIAVAIAALGIANSLLAAVRERWQEIGVLKALGADDRDVLAWFLVEAAALGAAGGLLGAIAGLAVAWGVGLTVNSYLVSQGLVGIDLSSIPLQLVILAPLGSSLVAMVAGALPALRAARLPAREAIGAL